MKMMIVLISDVYVDQIVHARGTDSINLSIIISSIIIIIIIIIISISIIIIVVVIIIFDAVHHCITSASKSTGPSSAYRQSCGGASLRPGTVRTDAHPLSQDGNAE